MARGDVISSMRTIVPISGTVDIQPGAGVEWLITELASDSNVDELFLQGVSGSATGDLRTIDVAGADNLNLEAWSTTPRKFLLTNTDYLRIRNSVATARNLIYSGIQTK